MNAESQEIIDELKPQLAQVKASELDRLTTHIDGDIYFDIWLDDSGDIQSAGTYHLVK